MNTNFNFEQYTIEDFLNQQNKFTNFIEHIEENQFQSKVFFSVITPYADTDNRAGKVICYEYEQDLIIINKNTTYDFLIELLADFFNQVQKDHDQMDFVCSHVKFSKIDISSIKLEFFKLNK